MSVVSFMSPAGFSNKLSLFWFFNATGSTLLKEIVQIFKRIVAAEYRHDWVDFFGDAKDRGPEFSNVGSGYFPEAAQGFFRRRSDPFIVVVAEAKTRK